jgi:hypothetical protein
MTTEKSSPLGLAIIVCDQIIEDKLTNKKSLIGIFNQIATASFPCTHPRVAVFVCLTEGRGNYSARLRIIHEETGVVVADLNGPIQFPDANAVVELNFDFVGLAFPQPGLYSIEFYCNDTLVLERRFHTAQLEPPSAPGAEANN